MKSIKKMIKYKIIIPLKLSRLSKRLKQLNEKWEMIESVTNIITHESYMREKGPKKLLKKITQVQELGNKITINRIKTTTEIFKLKLELKNAR